MEKNIGTQDKQIVRDLLIGYGFVEEVKNETMILYLSPDLDDMAAEDEPNHTNCALWYIGNNDFYVKEQKVCFGDFIRLIRPYVRERKLFTIDENSLLIALISIESYLTNLSEFDLPTPPSTLYMYLDVWMKYNKMLKESKSKHWDEEHEVDLINMVYEMECKFMENQKQMRERYPIR